jgi:polyhydroxybutyrate depolymerase
MKKWKNLLSVAALLILTFRSNSQQTIKSSIVQDGLTRTFSFYIPASYQAGKATPLVFNLHGYGSSGDEQEFYGDFRRIADTADFIVVHPDGTFFPNTTRRFWNCGLVGSSGVDDVGFIHALIDTLSKAYTIDEDRIYSTGMSNGGFMSYHLACVSNRFAAIASVAGSMTTWTGAKCQNANALPVMDIHGDADTVVSYNGRTGIWSIPDVINFWLQKNGLNASLVNQIPIPDINPNDGATALLTIYPGIYEVQHYKVINGGHTWPGAFFIIGTTCQDFKASEVIWQFFNRYKRQTVATTNLSESEIKVYPNPARDRVKIVVDDFTGGAIPIKCVNQFGVIVKQFVIGAVETQMDLGDLPPGIYFLHAEQPQKMYRTKLIKW